MKEKTLGRRCSYFQTFSHGPVIVEIVQDPGMTSVLTNKLVLVYCILICLHPLFTDDLYSNPLLNVMFSELQQSLGPWRWIP